MSTLCFFSENNGSIVLFLGKAAVSRSVGGWRVGVLEVPPLFYALLHRSSHEKRSLRWPGNLPVICRRDHHHVGRLGRSVSPRAAELPRIGLTTNNTMDNTHGVWYFADDR